jgi:hypothetical protein
MLLSATDEEQAKCQVDINEWFTSTQAQRKEHKGITLSGTIVSHVSVDWRYSSRVKSMC